MALLARRSCHSTDSLSQEPCGIIFQEHGRHPPVRHPPSQLLLRHEGAHVPVRDTEGGWEERGGGGREGRRARDVSSLHNALFIMGLFSSFLPLHLSPLFLFLLCACQEPLLQPVHSHEWDARQPAGFEVSVSNAHCVTLQAVPIV